jgi:hypothetical protein
MATLDHLIQVVLPGMWHSAPSIPNCKALAFPPLGAVKIINAQSVAADSEENMPYVRKSELRREKSRKKWMTLTEATHYIIEKESCEVHPALQQLFLAIVDGEVLVKRGGVHPDFTLGISPSEFQSALKICLKDEGSVKIDRDNKRFVIDPDSKKRRLNITIVSASDFRPDDDDDWAEDDTAGEDPLDYDPLWLRRKDVTELWGPRSAKSRNKRVPPASLKAIEKEARKLHEERSDNPPNMAEAEVILRERVRGATRNLIRSVLRRPEFVKLRRPRGHQLKR